MSRRDPLIRSLEVIAALAAMLYSALVFAEDTDTIAVLRGFGLTETQARVVAAAAEKSGKGEDYGPLRALLGNADVPVVLGAAALLMEAEEAFEKDAVALLRSGNGNATGLLLVLGLRDESASVDYLIERLAIEKTLLCSN